MFISWQLQGCDRDKFNMIPEPVSIWVDFHPSQVSFNFLFEKGVTAYKVPERLGKSEEKYQAHFFLSLIVIVFNLSSTPFSTHEAALSVSLHSLYFSCSIWGETVPTGYRFHPIDEELVGHYLKYKLNRGWKSLLKLMFASLSLETCQVGTKNMSCFFPLIMSFFVST